MNITFEGKFAGLIEGIKSDIIQDASGLLDRIGEKVVLPSIKKNFKEEGRPEKWAPLAERTRRERRAEGYNPDHPILERAGELKRSSIEKNGYPGGIYDLDKHKLVIQNVLSKGEKLQNGDWNLPARPFFGLQKEDGPLAEKEAGIYISKKLQEIVKG